ncbi:CHAP domain-containing protein [Guggenheimella bovis]
MTKRIILMLLVLFFLTIPSMGFALEASQNEWLYETKTQRLDKELVDIDGAYGAQCTDLVHHYVDAIFYSDHRETLGFGDASSLYYNASEIYFEKIPFELGLKPELGDIVVWGGGSGHIAVIKGVTDDAFYVFSQNSFGSGRTPVEEKCYYAPDYFLKYNSVRPIGYLRPRPIYLKGFVLERLNPNYIILGEE